MRRVGYFRIKHTTSRCPWGSPVRCQISQSSWMHDFTNAACLIALFGWSRTTTQPSASRIDSRTRCWQHARHVSCGWFPVRAIEDPVILLHILREIRADPTHSVHSTECDVRDRVK